MTPLDRPRARAPGYGVPMRALLLFVALGCAGRPTPAEPDPAPAPNSGAVVRESAGLDADLAATTAFFASRPVWERPWATGFEQVPGLPDLSAATCATCHDAIHAEWSTSVHAQAWVDPQYQAEIGKSDNRWLCLNCHTPLLSQQDRWPVDLVDGDVERPVLVPNPSFDPALRDQGITCAACHVRDGAIAGPGLGGTAPHPVVADPEFTTDALCRRCHDLQVQYPGKSFVCAFETGKELDAGPWKAEGADCTTCHMPSITRPAAIGGPDRTIGRHWWRGAGIPKQAGGPYPPAEANKFGLDVGARVDGDALIVQLTNANAGHMLPTGDPERWIQVDTTFTDGAGTALRTDSTRIGQTWAWEIPPRKVSDDRLAPRETREVRLPIPAGAVRAEIVASNHRISAENAEYHHLGDYPRSVETHRQTLDLGR